MSTELAILLINPFEREGAFTSLDFVFFLYRNLPWEFYFLSFSVVSICRTDRVLCLLAFCSPVLMLQPSVLHFVGFLTVCWPLVIDCQSIWKLPVWNFLSSTACVNNLSSWMTACLFKIRWLVVCLCLQFIGLLTTACYKLFSVCVCNYLFVDCLLKNYLSVLKFVGLLVACVYK